MTLDVINNQVWLHCTQHTNLWYIEVPSNGRIEYWNSHDSITSYLSSLVNQYHLLPIVWQEELSVCKLWIFSIIKRYCNIHYKDMLWSLFFNLKFISQQNIEERLNIFKNYMNDKQIKATSIKDWDYFNTHPLRQNLKTIFAMLG